MTRQQWRDELSMYLGGGWRSRLLWVTSIGIVAGAHPVYIISLVIQYINTQSTYIPGRWGWLGRGRVWVIGGWGLWRIIRGRGLWGVIGGWGLWWTPPRSRLWRVLAHGGSWWTLTWGWFRRLRMGDGWWRVVASRGLRGLLYPIPLWRTRSRGRWAWLGCYSRTRSHRGRLPPLYGGLWGSFWGLIGRCAAVRQMTSTGVIILLRLASPGKGKRQ